ncbi:MAG: hypothetical protein ACREH4_06555, partial [Vitreimonas sp.]
RIAAIVARIADRTPPPILPWLLPENRPGLRGLARRYFLRDEREDRAGAVRAAEALLRLNPDDNHGMRFELVNEYLLKHDDEGALALASAYLDDLAPETRFGRVLALLRLKRLTEAEDALRSARHALPKVMPYLLPARVKRPKLSEHGVTIGGADQAWLYRDRMRRAWEATPGAMDWLRKVARLR